jgi:hypothetical protein
MVGCETISKEKFEQIMDGLQGEEVWLKINTDTVNVDVIYPEFEFLAFVNEKYEFGVQDYDEESIIQNVCIKENEVAEIHRDRVAPTLNGEEIILTMIDGTEIFVRHNC